MILNLIVDMNNISIYDAFSKYDLNAGQTELVDRLDKFLSIEDEPIFLLKGYAGTGKTFITKGLTEYFSAIGRNYLLAAPTGKASKVIAEKTNSPAYTIHKNIYSVKKLIEYRGEDELDEDSTYKYYFGLRINELSVDTVYIVDEASMVSDNYSDHEFIRFGSGHLLRDFLKFVNLDQNDHSKKVIFIGDNAQLPPVGMSFSPALNGDYLLKEHNVRSVSYELTEVVRQKAESGVIHNSIKLRDSIKKEEFNQLNIDLDYPELCAVEFESFMEHYLESCQGAINDYSTVIAYSNADVALYNKRIREHFFPNQSMISSGDRVMVVKNSYDYGFFISNGEFGLIKKVLDESERRSVVLKRKDRVSKKVKEVGVSLVFKDVEIEFRDMDGTLHTFEAKILENLLYSEARELTSDETKALWVDFRKRHPHLKRGSLEFMETLQSDPYITALRLKFGYAITCHKAQGSEWNNVFVKCKNTMNQLSMGYFRWFYTAITRTADKLYLFDPPEKKLGGDIKMVKVKNDDDFGHDHLLEKVRNLIAGKDIVIKDINKNKFQEAYTFNRGEDSVRVDIYYNGKNKVTSIRPELPNDLSKELKTLLEPVKGTVFQGSNQENEDIIFQEVFKNDFHARIDFLAKAKKIIIHSVFEQLYSQRYTFIRDGEKAVFDVYFNKNKRFTKCMPQMNFCSEERGPESLFDTVQEIIAIELGN